MVIFKLEDEGYTYLNKMQDDVCQHEEWEYCPRSI